ncbi:MAG: bifunctional phosphopantothenoylcysteine decarboxylase/phosphopantothenate--cysteine ligase CoaBC [Rhodocyclaceae bacterium]|nr:bifunctional phosphopantothenoylcysteine decarboxylase/phosphopantothenate--cysteine ligase CoaBC [Rhodocyclaceae bacterium]
MAQGELSNRRIVLGVTGGVAAYKAAELTRRLVKAGAEVDVVLTAAATRFVGGVTFQALSGRPVWDDLWDARQPDQMAHIALVRGADAVLVAPATADFIARIACGLADDLWTTLCLAREAPLWVAPAMNRQMWQHPATQRNVAQVIADGAQVLGPDSGDQACGEVGFGRMLEPEVLYEELLAGLAAKPLAGRRVLMTAGPTLEALDPVRVLTNLSSGQMGYALARALRQAGAQVTLVSGPVALPTPVGVRRIDVASARDMHAAVMGELAAPGGQDLFIGVAAVADFRPEAIAGDKIKKDAAPPVLGLVRNPDILAEVASRADAPFCVGFAAESRDLDDYAQRKLRDKRLKLVVGNLVQDGLGGPDNRVVLYDASGRHALAHADKHSVARAIVAHIADLLGASERRDTP